MLDMRRVGRWGSLAALEVVAALALPSAAEAKVEIWSYSYAAQQGLDKAFPLPPAPATFLAGTLWFTAEQPIIVMGDSSDQGSKDRTVVGMMYAMAALAAMGKEPHMPADLKCSGDGSDDTHLMRVERIPAGMDEVDAAALCAQAAHLKDAWRSARLILNGAQYYAITEYRNTDNSVSAVYVDLTRWAEKVADEMP
jgi:hypothetical protein